MPPTEFAEKGPVVARLLALCDRLRGADGCPWDREQTLSTLTPYLLEELHESLEAIATGARDRIREELGDLFFVVIFALHASEREGIASVEEIVEGTVRKLIRRHPHVFEEPPGAEVATARERWQTAKREEAENAEAGASVLGKPAGAHPALLAAFRLQEKASAVGFDWREVDGPLAKIQEELDELRRDLGDPERMRHEVGDLLFAVVNASRMLRIDPESALRFANRRFYDRFRFIERRLHEMRRRPEDATLEEMDALWEEAKAESRPPGEGA
jgi:MazG family protein